MWDAFLSSREALNGREALHALFAAEWLILFRVAVDSVERHDTGEGFGGFAEFWC